MGTETIGVNVTCASGGTTSCPTKIPVRKAKGTTIVINWNATGERVFPTSGFFSWKPGPNPGELPTRSSDGKKLTLTYNIESTVTWAYNIMLEGCGNFDPEIENQIPPTPDPEEDVVGGGGSQDSQ